MSCPFCTLDRPTLAESRLAFAIADARPVSPGHALVIPRRHVASYFDCTVDERAEMWSLVDRVRAQAVDNLHPDGFNLGVNVGLAAGQTVFHAHIHVIPRYTGDVDDPRGGIRNSIAPHPSHGEPGPPRR